MKPKRFFFHQTQVFGVPLRCGVPLAFGFMAFFTGLDANAGDILRGGSNQGGAGKARGGNLGGAPPPSATDAARANARDTLARTTKTLNSIRAMQNAARNAAKTGPNNLGKNPLKPTINLPKVPNGLVTGGLRVSGSITTDPTKWKGAELPKQIVKNGKTKVTIKQTEQQALLEWETFNVGKNTTLTFNQKKGGENSGQWIAFNKVNDTTANPTQILGDIKADGQVYIINPNGIIFGGSSQVNARGLTVSSLPINTNLLDRGLLNNPDAQFLFSGLKVPGGADGTPDFNPGAPPDGGRFGDVIVQKGAVLKSPSDGGGNGGRIMLAAPNVINHGTISTEAGQTVLAAGLQVGVAAHDANDPSLRGLDVWVGDVGDYGGTIENRGIIEALEGSISLTGKSIRQNGALESSTSVSLNGRIDIRASYGAVSNPNFDSVSAQGAGGPMFLNQHTGTLEFGETSVTRILPDYLSKKEVPGTELPERSQVNVEGHAVHFGKESTLLAPNAEVNVRAGTWTYKDINGDRTIFDNNGNPEPFLATNYSSRNQRFLFDSGQVHIDTGATLSVAGSVDVFVPISHTLLTIRLLGSELADSPLQRDTDLRGRELVVDLSDSGSYNGKFWMGTPLGDATGLANLIERNVAQLTAKGGDISMTAGQSLVVRQGATVDVSGGYFKHEGGRAETTHLIKDGRLVPMTNATPDQLYDGVFNGQTVFNSAKWGVSNTFSTPLFTGKVRQSFVEGAAGGNLALTAPSMALDGSLLGRTIDGPRQSETPAAGSSIRISFESQKSLGVSGGAPVFVNHSPTPPAVRFTSGRTQLDGPEFALANGSPQPLPTERVESVALSSKLLDEDGFSSLEVFNPDGTITVPESVALATRPGGAVSLTGANLTIDGGIVTPGGTINLTALNLSPSFIAEYNLITPSPAFPFPQPVEGRGVIRLGASAVLSAAGLFTDDRHAASSLARTSIRTSGGSISLRSFSADLAAGSKIDVSGSARVSDRGTVTYGNAGTIAIATGNDPGFAGVTGGDLKLGSRLLGFSGAAAGSLAIQAGRIEIGSKPVDGALHLDSGFFSRGGFGRFDLTGIGAPSDATPQPGLTESYDPAVRIASGTVIAPVVKSLFARRESDGRIVLERVTAAQGLRSPVKLSFTALGADDPFTLDTLEIRGDVRMEAGSSIITDPGGSVSFKGGTVTLLGSVTTPGGSISVAGAGAFPLTSEQRQSVRHALATVHIGKQARLDASGATVLLPDTFGRNTGRVLAGGTITVSGNIIAEKGAVLDVSGTSDTLDLAPTQLASDAFAGAYPSSGLLQQPLATKGVATTINSNGGLIDLTGSQMLLSDATLRGKSGGTGAVAGTLSISSGRYYNSGETATGADINLVVRQSGDVILDPAAGIGVGRAPLDGNGQTYANLGHFSLTRFEQGGFHSLELGGKYVTSGAIVPYGGNILFEGPINLRVPGSLRLAAGGVISATDSVRVSAAYLAVGQDFRPPANPGDIIQPFQIAPSPTTPLHQFAPTAGSGTLSLNAGLIDVGTLATLNIGSTALTSREGDIRGNGILSVAGELTLTAARVYPTTLSSFSIFAYDPAGGAGKVTIRTSGKPTDVPLSVGGRLEVYASQISHTGFLHAPMGTITLGWDGTDLNPDDADLDTPFNLVVGNKAPVPVTESLVVGNGAVTSVSAAFGKDNRDWLAPFGISPDGQSWVDPRGVNITLAGMPGKYVNLTAKGVTLKSGAKVDLRGGGDLLASRWILGSGGSVDLLGSPSSAWGAGTSYSAGDLVTHGGKTWSARVAHNGQQPTIGRYWTQVAEAFAIMPVGGPAYIPENSFNTGTRAGELGGDPGFSTAGLSIGDTITVEGSKALAAGTYVLLPKRYALLPGALLVTPKSGGSVNGTIKTSEGAFMVKGRLGSTLAPDALSPQWSMFEIAPAKVLSKRVEYQLLTANKFIADISENSGEPQALPNDGGKAVFHGNESLRLAGQLLSESPGLSTTVDISSFADIRLTTGNAKSSATGGVTLSTKVLNSWKVGSLAIGGIRRTTDTGTTVLDVRTDSLSVSNSGRALVASDIILASRQSLDLAAGSAVRANDSVPFRAGSLSLSGNGALVRASADPSASVSRTTTANTATASFGERVVIAGASILSDSSGSTRLASSVSFKADDLTLSSGLIQVAFDGANAPAITDGLTLRGDSLATALQAENLTLRSYQTIDFFGAGTFGSSDLKSLNLFAGGIRGYDTGGTVRINAGQVRLENNLNVAQSASSTRIDSSLAVNAKTITFGPNAFHLSGFGDLSLNASERIVTEGSGSFTTPGSITASAPLVTGASGSAFAMNAGGAMRFASPAGSVPSTADQLGARLSLTALSIEADTSIVLPSGNLTLTATGGEIRIGGTLSTAGSAKAFNDLIRYSDGGLIRLEARAGDVTIVSGATVSVAAAAGGGNAGTFEALTPQGLFESLGTLSGSATEGFSSGRFRLDVSRFDETGAASFGTIENVLRQGGFSKSLDFRVRNGDVNIAGLVTANAFSLAADRGSILVTGTINSSGTTGGSISLAARDNLTVANGAILTVAAESFNSAGKGGSIRLEAGTSSGGIANAAAMLSIETGSTINLGVRDYVAGTHLDNGSSASLGRFSGTLHLRAPRTADDLGVASIGGSIIGASSILAEGYRIYQPANGTLNIALRNQIDADSRAWIGAPGTLGVNEAAMTNRLLSGNPTAAALGQVLVLAPGVEIINPTGDLTLGQANNIQGGITSAEALHTADWDLSSFRYGSRSAPGVLTLRAAGDLVFNNTLSDGFTPIAQGSPQVFADNGHSLMWLAPLATIRDSLPVNTQSWSYRLTAGADLTAGDFRDVMSANELEPDKGSVLVGEFYPAVPNTLSSGNAAATGPNGQTADSIRISSNNTNRGNRFEVIRTGTGDITVSAGRDVQLRNTFSSIYTAGVALPDPTRIFEANDFFIPVIPTSVGSHPSQTVTGTLGAIQQLYAPAWSMAGGNISLEAARNIGRYTLVNGVLTVHSSRQMPTNWLFRRGFVDPTTGLFASNGGFGSNPTVNNATNINDQATSTAWWIDYSNFFQSVGTLGGGDISMTAGNDVVNMDAVAPTNARMAGRVKNPDFGSVAGAPEFINLAPDGNRMIEFGGGDIQIRGGRNIDGGIYYVERGRGTLNAGGAITTNAARSPSLDVLNDTAPYDPLTWMPTTLFLGKSSFDVTASGDILLGPLANPFMLPQGLNNKYWYKTHFNTFSADARVNVVSLGGGVTHRTKINLPFGASPGNLLELWYQTQLFYNGVGSALNASNYQPWLRLSELGLNNFGRVFDLAVPSLSSTAMGGDIRLAGDLTLAPSPRGTLELAASGSVIGLNPVGTGRFNNTDVMVWSSATVNLSDAPAGAIPSHLNPLGYQTLAGRERTAHFQSGLGILDEVNRSLLESGSFTGEAVSARTQAALHDSRLLRGNDENPLQIQTLGGDITGLTLFSPKHSRIISGRDISDVSFYLQNLRSDDISLVSAGRDIIAFDAASPVRSLADNLLVGNLIGDLPSGLTGGSSTKAMAGDIRISGPGLLEVLAGRDIDLGSGANFTNGTGTGITAIGNLRNPFLPFAGADLVVMAGFTAASGIGPATGLATSSLDFTAFIDRYLRNPDDFNSEYLSKLDGDPEFEDLNAEQQAIVALERFYRVLRKTGRDFGKTGDYDSGYTAIKTLFGNNGTGGEVSVRSREIRTITGGTISLGVPDGGITMASEIFGNPLTPPGIVTEFGGSVNTFTDQSVDLGQARIFTLRGGDIIMWSSEGNIAAGTSPRTVVTAPPTRVVIDSNTATVQTDLGGLATGGGIGVLAAVEGVKAGNVDLIAPKGFVDAGDAGIRVTGNLNIAANTVINAGNISAGGSTSGSAVSAPAAPSVSAVTTASNSAAATTATPQPAAENQKPAAATPEPEPPSVYTVQVIGYGGGDAAEDEEDEDETEE